jgi:hypothetical protein
LKCKYKSEICLHRDVAGDYTKQLHILRRAGEVANFAETPEHFAELGLFIYH